MAVYASKRHAIIYIFFLLVISIKSLPLFVEPDQSILDEYFFEQNEIENEIEGEFDPEVSPGLYEGDIAGLTPEIFIRLGLKWEVFPNRKWTNGTVPYSISIKYLPDEVQLIETAISTLNFFTCINFVPWNGKTKDYLLIWPMVKPSGCWSFIGRTGGQQVVSLQRPDKSSLRCLGTIGKPIHELLHALGTFHEQARGDRDNHIAINYKNVIPGRAHNFNKVSSENSSFPYPYDYESVMHYGTHFFTNDRKKATIVSKKKGAEIGQRTMLSKGDCMKINDLYGCFNRDPFESDKYRAFCNYLAL